MPVAWCSCVRCREVKEQLMMLAGHCSQHRVTFDLAVDIVVFLMCSLILHVRRSTTALRSSTCLYTTLLYPTPPTQFAHTVLLMDYIVTLSFAHYFIYLQTLWRPGAGRLQMA